MNTIEKKVRKIVLADILFVFLLVLSGMISELSDFFYIASFAAPALFLILTEKPERRLSPLLRRRDIPSLLLAAPLLIGGVFVIAFITSRFFSLFGIQDTTELSGDLFSVIVSHALLPAFLEELLFRYAPIRMLGDMKRGNVIILTSALFALAHCDLQKLPYAFFAGLVFATLDIVAESILPSLILHVLNNLVSIFHMRFFSTVFPTVLYISLGALSLISIFIILLKRNTFKEKFWSTVTEFEPQTPRISVAVFAVAALAIAILNITWR